MQIRRSRLFDTRIVLGHDSEKFFVTMQRIEQRKGALAPDCKRLYAPRE